MSSSTSNPFGAAVKLMVFGSYGVARIGADKSRCAACGAVVAQAVLVNCDPASDGAVVLADTGDVFDLNDDGAIVALHRCRTGS